MRTITENVPAWISASSQKYGHDADSVTGYAYHKLDMSTAGWVLAGKATITVEIEDEDTLRKNMIVAIRAEQKAERAKAQRIDNQYEERIQSLLALPAPSEATE